jgi:hypothetical protein
VVGLSKFNESVQKLKNGQVAGYVASNPFSRGDELTCIDQSHCRRLQQGLKMSERVVVMDVLDVKHRSIGPSRALEAVCKYYRTMTDISFDDCRIHELSMLFLLIDAKHITNQGLASKWLGHPSLISSCTNPHSTASDHYHTNTEPLFATRVRNLNGMEMIISAFGPFTGSSTILYSH